VASNFSVDGLVSGMSTSQIVSQLMSLEAAPQQALKNKVTDAQSTVAAYQNVNMRFGALKIAADTLAKPETWQALSVSSSSSTVSASASSAAISGSMTFNVTDTARAHGRRSDAVTGLTGAGATMATTAGLDFTINNVVPAVHVDVTDTSLSGVVTAINANKTLGITAAAVQVSPGQYRLQLTSAKTGEAGNFTVAGLSVADEVVSAGADAKILVGSGIGAYEVTSSTNTFTGVLPGVTFTVSSKQDNITLSTNRNTGSIADKMQAVVDAANQASAEMDKQGAFVPGGKSGTLAGDYTLRMLDDKLSSTVATALADGKSLSVIGVQLDKSGKYTFDRAKFAAAYEADPVTTQTRATEFAVRISTLADKATKSGTGTLTQAVDSQTSTITDLNKRISDWDTRLAARQATLQRQFSAMEVALGKLKSQGTWLSGQISSLPSYSTN
jgi:flagellar hook-associated protein 2